MGERVKHPLPHLDRPRLDELRGGRDGRLRHRRVERRLAKLDVDASDVGLGQPGTNVLTQLLEVVESRVDREVVIDGREQLQLDLLDGDVEGSRSPGQVRGAVVLGEGTRAGALPPRARPAGAPLEAGNQVSPAELDELVTTLATGKWRPLLLPALR